MFWETAFDVVSLGFSIWEVVQNPKDPWAWAGLVGDAIDLLPIVTGVGETTRAIKTANNLSEVADNLISKPMEIHHLITIKVRNSQEDLKICLENTI